MDPIPSAAEMYALVISFVQIAVGEPIETAKHFLQEGKWRVEDALELFYKSSEVQVADSAPFPTPEARVADSTSFPTTNSSGLPEFVTRRRPRSYAQIVADAVAGASVCTDFITCRRRRTRAEMTMDIPLTATGSLASTSSSRGARRPRRPTAKVTSGPVHVGNEAASLGVENLPDEVGEHRTGRRSRTRAEMTHPAQMLIPPSTSPLFFSVDYQPHVSEDMFINTTSLFANPVSSTQNTQPSPLPAFPDAVATRTHTVPRQRRTRLELDAASAPTGVPTYSKSYSVRRVQPPMGLAFIVAGL